MTEYTPKTLHHPAYDAGAPARFRNSKGEDLPVGVVSGDMVSAGKPCRFPPVDVKTQSDEDAYRAKGYRAKGEAAPMVEGYHDYPKMLVHPDHVDGVPDEICAHPKEEGKPLSTYVVKGIAEKFPHATANNEAEEAEWNAKGYRMPVIADPMAFQKARAVPFKPGQTASEYPRWENGILISDPSLNTSGRQEYPKWIGDKLANSAKEEFDLLQGGEFTNARVEYLITERRQHSESGDDAAVDRIEKMLSDNGIEVSDRPHGTVWRRTGAVSEEARDPQHQAVIDDARAAEKSDGREAAAKVYLDGMADLVRKTLVDFAEARGIKVEDGWSNDDIIQAMAKSQEAVADEKKAETPRRQPPTLTPEQQAEKAALIAEAEAKGVKVDKRWSADKIVDAITRPVAVE